MQFIWEVQAPPAGEFGKGHRERRQPERGYVAKPAATGAEWSLIPQENYRKGCKTYLKITSLENQGIWGILHQVSSDIG